MSAEDREFLLHLDKSRILADGRIAAIRRQLKRQTV
jgi:hypothetical protein